MREMDFSEKNLFSRWLGVKSMWEGIEGEVKQLVKTTLEQVMEAQLTAQVGCGRYERSIGRRGYRNGCYARGLLTTYGWIEGLKVPCVRQGGFDSLVFEKYHRRQRALDQVLLEAFFLGLATRDCY